MNVLTIALDAGLPKPLYEQIYEFIKEEIQRGGLPYQERLPSTRMLAAHLEVSRSTVALAYEQLLSEGYVESQPGRGYFVSSLEGLYCPPRQEENDAAWHAAKTGKTPGAGKVSDAGKAEEPGTWDYDFSPSGVDLGRFPHGIWRRISRNVLMEDDSYFFRLGEPAGEEDLRRAIAAYVHQARGVNCTAQQVVIGAGNDYLLMLLHAVLGQKRVYAMENPTYKKACEIFRTLGNRVVPVRTDEGGMDVASLAKSGASIAYVMPSHQYPLGIVMPAGRRRQLLNWAAEEEDRYVIEDDYDSEFRYRGRPIPALQGMDSNEKVIYIGTFSKSIAPAIRISFLVLPRSLMESYERRGKRFSSTVPRMEQRILTEFIKNGAYERHLNRMRALYKSRHDALLESLKQYPQLFRVSGEYAGTHLLAVLPEGISERQALNAAKQAGIRVYALSEYAISPEEDDRLSDAAILGKSNTPEVVIKSEETDISGDEAISGEKDIPQNTADPGEKGISKNTAVPGKTGAVLVLGYAHMDEESICRAVKKLAAVYQSMIEEDHS